MNMELFFSAHWRY